MKTTPPPTVTSEPTAGNVMAWLADARADEYFGKSYVFKADILAAVIRGEKLAPIARQHGVSRAAASAQGRRARAIFGNLASSS